MTTSAAAARRVVGAMTGTSIDGLDLALVEIHGRGLDLRAAVRDHASRPLGALAEGLRALAEGAPLGAGAIAPLALELGALHADAIAALVGDGATIDLVAAHGQTVVHDPPVSWQLLDPAPIAARLGCPVVTDLRAADLAAGGQGAPITPLSDWILFRDARRRRAVVNLGGFCNVTLLPRADAPQPLATIRGFDLCVCNHVLDGVARAALSAPFDRDGQAAAAGHPDGDAGRELTTLLLAQASPGRSLGTGDELASWPRRHLPALEPRDLAATAVHAVAGVISERLAAEEVDETVIAGGGARNRALVAALERRVTSPVRLSTALGVPVQVREAAGMAILGALCADGVAITLPQVTGCRPPAPIAGTWSGPRRPSRQG